MCLCLWASLFMPKETHTSIILSPKSWSILMTHGQLLENETIVLKQICIAAGMCLTDRVKFRLDM